MSAPRNRTCGPCTAILGCLLAVGAAGAVAATDDVGQPAPALIARQLDGQTLDLAALAGRVVVLNIWASWCVPCRAEMPLLEKFYERYSAQGVTIIGLSADDPHERKAVSRAMRGISYPAALLVDAKPNGFGAPQVLPTTYVIGPDGVIRARLLPTRQPLTMEALEAAVLPLLGGVQATKP